MEFTGNQEKSIQLVHNIMKKFGVKGKTIFDPFCGSTEASKFFKRNGYKVISSDQLHVSWVLQKTYIESNKQPTFDKLRSELKSKFISSITSPIFSVFSYLNQIKRIEGFVYENYCPSDTFYLEYPKYYITNENGGIVGKIRWEVKTWLDNGLISKEEYYFLTTSLLESTAKVINAPNYFNGANSDWDKRAVKRLVLKPVEIIESEEKHIINHSDSASLLSSTETDILYMHPPSKRRQYSPNLHILETISFEDLYPFEGGKEKKEYQLEKSNFCSPKKAEKELKKYVDNGKYKYLILCYPIDAILKHNVIMKILSTKGDVKFEDIEYVDDVFDYKEPKKQEERVYVLTKK